MNCVRFIDHFQANDGADGHSEHKGNSSAWCSIATCIACHQRSRVSIFFYPLRSFGWRCQSPNEVNGGHKRYSCDNIGPTECQTTIYLLPIRQTQAILIYGPSTTTERQRSAYNAFYEAWTTSFFFLLVDRERRLNARICPKLIHSWYWCTAIEQQIPILNKIN